MSFHKPRLCLQILSDLHLSRGGLQVPDTDADLIILAGDISRPKSAIEWALDLGKPAIYVTGNHEHYGAGIQSTHQTLRELCSGTPITLLDREQTVFQGVRFLGATLWTDFMLYGDGAKRKEAMALGLKYMRDYTRIKSDRVDGAAFTPDDAAALFAQHLAWLKKSLAIPFDGPTVVITHHAPSAQSIHPRFADSPVNPCFVSDLEHLMGSERVALWIHGHTHDSFDYRVNGTRVVCNPRGYLENGQPENPLFDPGLVVAL